MRATVVAGAVVKAAPSFSVIVPTRSRPEQLGDCLKSLARLEYPRDSLQVIVVDDGSSVLPEAQVCAARRELDLLLVSQPHRGPAAARNAGASRADGEYLAFTDDDCRPAPGWLRNLAARARDAPGSALGGQTLNALFDNLCSTASQMLISYLYSYYNRDAEQARFFASNNLAFPAALFRTMGGFDARFAWPAGEDRELCDRCLSQGVGLVYVPGAVVYHAHSLTLRGFCTQHWTYGRSAFDFRELRAQRGGGRVRLEPLTFYRDLLLYPSSRSVRTWAFRLAALLMLSQVANATGFVWEGLNRLVKGRGELSLPAPRQSGE